MNRKLFTEGNEANEVEYLLPSLRSLCLLLLISVFAGCADKRFFVPTQTVTTVTATNAATLLPSTNFVTNTIYSVNPGVSGALNTGRTIAQDVGGPWGMIISGGLGLLSAGLGWIAKKKSDQAALLPAIITGVESAAGNQEVKAAIEKVARAAGVESRLNALVQKITK